MPPYLLSPRFTVARRSAADDTAPAGAVRVFRVSLHATAAATQPQAWLTCTGRTLGRMPLISGRAVITISRLPCGNRPTPSPNPRPRRDAATDR